MVNIDIIKLCVCVYLLHCHSKRQFRHIIRCRTNMMRTTPKFVIMCSWLAKLLALFSAAQPQSCSGCMLCRRGRRLKDDTALNQERKNMFRKTDISVLKF
jgi:hypothetical protein